jgi:putative ATPase
MPAKRPTQEEKDLFTKHVEDSLAARGPLAARLRPRTLEEIIGQRHLLAQGAALRALIEADRLSSIILWGPPGTGKTTLAQVIANTTHRHFVSLSAVTAGVKDVRDTIEVARRELADHDRGTILFLDEVHRFNKAQQDALLPAVESGLLTLIGATTENPFFEVNAPLLSRSTLFRLEPLDDDDMRVLVGRGVDAEGATAEADAVDHIINEVDGDGRAAHNSVEIAVALARAREPDAEKPHVTLADVEEARQSRAISYGVDEHYDIISAFIKSIRGSDPDAGLYWLARMLAAGEDARFIARRLVILASEDVGMAEPMGLVVADAAARAVEFVGLPEAGLNLAQAVVYLAVAPKSNRSTIGLIRASQDVKERPAGPVPNHLRSAHPWERRKLGTGTGYDYSQAHEGGFARQQYRPDGVGDRVYYHPSAHGAEEAIAERLRHLWGDDRYDADTEGFDK